VVEKPDTPAEKVTDASTTVLLPPNSGLQLLQEWWKVLAPWAAAAISVLTALKVSYAEVWGWIFAFAFFGVAAYFTWRKLQKAPSNSQCSSGRA
jgi:hypothetical protein